MNKKPDIITIGESLIELSTNQDITNARCLDKYYGGDTLTTAVAALKLGANVGFISRIGMDCFKNYLLESWQEAGLDISQVKPVQGINGIYIISKSDDSSSKEFSFYRKKTAATNLSSDDISPDYIKSSSIVYSTGITQSLSLSAREAVLTAFQISKENNVTTAYDPNYTSKIWTDSDAREAFNEIIEYTDVLFLNAKYDSKIVIDSNSIDNTIKYLSDKGVTAIIIKSPCDKGYYVSNSGKTEFINYINENPVDTTGSGDTFNGAVLYGISSGMPVFKAVKLGAAAAALQCRNFGAVKSIPDKEEVYEIFKGLND